LGEISTKALNKQ